jgi:hypothetical protein
MLFKNISIDQLNQALELTNKKYAGNVEFKNIAQKSKNVITATLKVKSSRGKGAKLGVSGLMGYGTVKHTVSACWHVHGNFFESVFMVSPSAEITSLGKKITVHGGNWEDFNIGSIIHPVYASEACEC